MRAFAQETSIDYIIEHLPNRLPITVNVEQDDWFFMQAQLVPGQDCQQFAQRGMS